MGNFEKGFLTGVILSSSSNSERSDNIGCGCILFVVLILVSVIGVGGYITEKIVLHVPPGSYTNFNIEDETLTTSTSDNSWVPNENVVTNFQYYIAKSEKYYLPDATGNTYKKILWYDIDCNIQDCSKENGFIMTSISSYKSEKNQLSLDLSNFDYFQGTLSILPIPNFKHVYKTSWKDVKSHMIFSFYNEKNILLATYTIDSKTKPIKFSIKLNGANKLYIKAQSDLKDRIVAGIYSPTLLKK